MYVSVIVRGDGSVEEFEVVIGKGDDSVSIYTEDIDEIAGWGLNLVSAGLTMVGNVYGEGYVDKLLSDMAEGRADGYRLTGAKSNIESGPEIEYTPDMISHGQYGICAHCKLPPNEAGHDGCIGTLPYPVMNACCGHGRDSAAYIQYFTDPDNPIQGEEAKRIMTNGRL